MSLETGPGLESLVPLHVFQSITGTTGVWNAWRCMLAADTVVLSIFLSSVKLTQIHLIP